MCAQTFHWISQSDGMYAAGVSDPAENTHHKGKYHCMSDRFDWFGFDHATKAAANSTLAKHLDSRLRELECSLPRHKVPCLPTLVTTLLGVPIFTSYQ